LPAFSLFVTYIPVALEPRGRLFSLRGVPLKLPQPLRSDTTGIAGIS
jgi:hypothetical protein